MSPVSDNEILNAFEIVLPYLADLFDNEASISLMDTEKCLINQSCPALAIRAVPGDRMPEGGAARQAIDTGTTVIKDIPKKSNDSVPFKSYSVPIKDEDGNVIGAISMGKSLAKREEVTSFSQILSSNLSQITVAVNDLSTTIQDVVKTNSENIVFVNDTNEKAGETNEILSVVRKVARQTHLLGINASIEAARAGQNGKSFEVVANEIRSLSDSVSNSMNKMEDVLSGINEAIAGIKIRIEKTNETFQNQAASLEEVAASIDSLNHTAYKLNELSEML